MIKRATRHKAQVQAVLGIGGVFLMLMLGLVLFRPAPPPAPGKLLLQAVAQLEQMDKYNLIIEEKAPGYSLLFRGQVEKATILTGVLPNYNLEVFHAGDGIFVRKTGEDEWEEALELKSLSGFLISPLEVLQTQTANFASASAGREAEMNGVMCRTIYLDLVQEVQLIKTLFPQINDTAIQSVNLGVALREPEMTVAQLRILVEFTDARTLERAYYLD